MSNNFNYNPNVATRFGDGSGYALRYGVLSYSDLVSLDLSINSGSFVTAMVNALARLGSNPQNSISTVRCYPINFKEKCNLTDEDIKPLILNGQPLTYSLGPLRNYPVYNYYNISVGEFDFGTITITPHESQETFMDYAPRTNLMLYLPFYETLYELNNTLYMGKTIHIKGRLNQLSGDMTYYISVIEEDNTETLLDSVKAHIAVDIQLYSDNGGEIMSNVAKAFVFMASHLSRLIPQTERPELTAVLESKKFLNGISDVYGNMFKPLKPYVFVLRPNNKYLLDNEDYNHTYGRPLKKIDTLSNLGGFTRVDEIHTPDIPSVTDVEMKEIEQLLRSGIILDNINATFTINYNTPNLSWSAIWGQIDYGLTFTNTFTVGSGYQIDSMTVTMGGVDITSTALQGNTITIPNVTGNILIKAVTSEIPVTYTVMSDLNGAILTNPAVTVLEGNRYFTEIQPNYTSGHIGKNYIPTVTMGGVAYTGNVSTFNTVINRVTDDIVFSGTYPSVTKMNVSYWSMRSGSVILPDDVETVTGVRITTTEGQVESSGSVVFDNSLDTEFNNAFISFEGNVIGGASNVTIGINLSGKVFYRDGQNDIVEVGFITRFVFRDTDDWITQPTLLEYMDKNFLYNG